MQDKTSPQGRASLEDVAKLSGVSTATVSRVLNGSTTVRQSRREAVERACEELGYVINRAARTLASRRSMTIGAVVPTLATETFSRTLAAFQHQIHKSGYTLLLANSEFDPDIEFREVNKLVEYGIDALLLVGHTHHQRLWERIEQHKIPCIQTFSIDTQHPSIGYDSVKAAQRVTEHLLSLGHKKFGMIAGTPPTNDRVYDRLRGIREVLNNAGLSLPESNLIECAFSINDARKGLFTLLDGPEPPTAVICGNDMLAFGAMRAASERYMRIPNDISIAGFNDYEYAEHLEHPLTTMRVELDQIGLDAAEYLLATLNGETVKQQWVLEPELIVRSSTGSAPRQGR
ncbi:LacI family DNA-binding transcriptional regulator [Rouxiella badensis]|uniref:LacI family DNA-binding transcriptional regulator n=1 Tax=Rouxiella TaxID=1565532 RepID=UPI001264D08B|nr:MULTISPECIES: LacI family DNA-binding transcriptional regulator [Rouxiella]KAB7893255.1 LacI family DNA-binding transcriptional regulator [Rouxiella sp. S1S-2]MCC3721497.1 LacI family DNA-binding transcriptional regulator [Rouxiella badensis]MCC3731053.1 LacI family DNA-binding transcriptional regulator [Rouxiella badensis]MCC3735891.1 LacI family DNA-binding transcriptional regulator [Rouxiella badensis]MCC3742671.1 LacI family DNA-binding transcriptional regulator [Rouxiella badensis]